MRIGLFDSGIGGLTVLKEFLHQYPDEEYIYVGDTARLPYGTKTREELLQLSSAIIEFLIEKKVDMIVIACGTVSSNVYPILKERYHVPIYDILSPTFSYLSKHYQKVGVFATPKTIESHIFQTSLEPNVEVYEVACPSFVPFIESGEMDSPLLDHDIKEKTRDFVDDKVEAIVLGCTHYPLLSDHIHSYLPENIDLINMGKVLVSQMELPGGAKSLSLYFSKVDSVLIQNVQTILGKDVVLEEKEW